MLLLRRRLNKFTGKDRHSIRLKDYNYSWPGFYFVTICVKDKECCLGKIIEFNNSFDGPIVKLTKLGEIVKDIWWSIPKHHQMTEIDEFIIMPNHLHGIIIINNGRGDARNVNNGRGDARIAPTRDFKKQPSGSLATIIGSFKSEVSKQIHFLDGWEGFTWQRNYYEHIIRNEISLDKIRNYIIDNPRKWQDDIENPNNNFNQKTSKRLL